ncbi:MFS transporter [Bacillus cereus]|uniref:MFS transporter n=1 Tax=Bacillus cereus group TaxID=86661 RepID=UPI000BEE1D81|nr:MFS transporter [Bacillus cereus]PDZ02818.1 MFS transporter [Bacillus cereus]PFE46454.1 MFS transporter [Bacillus cereus]PFN13438.1 MFS transporter [Bacillus cereus]PFO67291.1 MFS transporter [Bacillus cereus]PFS65102.1 MFS transporter [Bacillus cereus]
MTTNAKESALSNKQKILAFTLTLLTFVMGTSEFVIVGLLTEVSTDLRISVTTAGTLISGFAIAYAIGTPIFTGFVGRFPKYPLMLILISIFILGNVVSAMAISYTTLIVSRVVTAVVSGVLTALSMSIANDAMPKSKRSSIIALIFSGFTIANVMGVPLGTFVGQFGSWHVTFWLTALLGVIAFIMSMLVLPRNLQSAKSSLKDQLSLFTQPRIILAFFIPTFTIAGTYTIYTYITPILENALAIPSKFVSFVLFIYGVFSIFSNFLAGRIAKQNGVSKLRYTFIIQAIILISLYFTMTSTIMGLISIMLMAVMLYAANATIQVYFMDLAEKYSPATKDFASSLTPVATNVGIALGSALGGIVVKTGSFEHLSWVGGLAALIASGLAFISYRLDKKDTHAEIKNPVSQRL